MVEKEKGCNYCAHGKVFGFHAVRIDCNIDGKSMCGYSGKNEYRLYAKDCPHFKPGEYLITEEEINWI